MSTYIKLIGGALVIVVILYQYSQIKSYEAEVRDYKAEVDTLSLANSEMHATLQIIQKEKEMVEVVLYAHAKRIEELSASNLELTTQISEEINNVQNVNIHDRVPVGISNPLRLQWETANSCKAGICGINAASDTDSN